MKPLTIILDTTIITEVIHTVNDRFNGKRGAMKETRRKSNNQLFSY